MLSILVAEASIRCSIAWKRCSTMEELGVDRAEALGTGLRVVDWE
jgi:hypothetical protein